MTRIQKHKMLRNTRLRVLKAKLHITLTVINDAVERRANLYVAYEGHLESNEYLSIKFYTLIIEKR